MLSESNKKTGYKKLNRDLLNFHTQFESLKSSPQTMMAVAKNIILARGLTLRVNTNIKIIRSELYIPELLSEYNHFVRNVYNYEKETYQRWMKDANKFEKHYLRNKNDLMFFDENKLVSRFNKEIFCFMNTVRHLLLLKFDMPKDLMILVESRYDIYYNKFQIDKLVGLYNEFVDKISKDAPVLLVMNSWCDQIKFHLQPGFEKKNSLVTMKLPQFIENSFNCLKQINSILSIIKSYEKDITKTIELIENLTFFPTDFYEENNILDISETFDKFKARINGNVAVITGAMTYIAQGINLIEHTCFGTATGCHKRMRLYYEKYENALFDAFTRFKKFRFLSEKQDELIIRRFTETNPTLDDYNEKIGFFISLYKMIEEYKYMDLGCVRLDNTKLINKFMEQCQFWISIYGKSLKSHCKTILTTFLERIMALEEQLNTYIRNDEDVSVVCKAIEEIKKTNIDADITFKDIHNRFHLLVKHNIIIPKEQFSMFKKIKTNWENLYIEALGKNFCIEDAKNRLLKSNKK
ncbi:uncharacterized protein LOC112691804 [Sipha flava]|uniref:Uncharacterized protein LOC112691804 n=1 Tax=Sipha flava TaxID=143950 RepID=A0A8B8GHC0_9HEMI|nr:uncharacterized protein LOC112691804 [Sipha flava]